jgi:hypothetical protein
MRYRFSTILLIFFTSFCFAQDRLLVDFSYGLNFPGLDLNKRFGNGFILKNRNNILIKNNWIVGIDGSIIFGNKVKEDVISPLRNNQGLIIGSDQQIAEVFLRQRAFNSNIIIGKWISKKSSKFERGVEITTGLGFLQHKIRIVDNYMSVIQLSGEYIKGYDRLTNGIAIPLGLSYRWIANDGRLNVFIQSETLYSPTKERRSIQHDTLKIPNQKRNDVFQSFSIGITLPFDLTPDTEKVYY